MFGSIGGFEIIVIAVIGLLVFGPRRLPEIARNLGRTVAELRKAAMEMRGSIERELNVEEVRKATRAAADSIRTDLLTGGPPPDPGVGRDARDTQHTQDTQEAKDGKSGGGDRKV